MPQTCEGCKHMRARIRILWKHNPKGLIDYRSCVTVCRYGLVWNESKKEPQKFELGTHASSKDYIYEKWRVTGVRCTEYDSMY